MRGRFGASVVVAAVAVATCSAGTSPPDLSRGGRIHVAAIQLTEVPGGLAANEANVATLVREAAERGARYIVLPEYFPGQIVNEPGMTLEEVRAQAEPADGPLATGLLRLARELDVFLAFPLAERRADGAVYNSTVYAGPRGIEGVYSKMLLIPIPAAPDFDAGPQRPQRWNELAIYTQGKSVDAITWGGVRVGPLICADGGVPALYKRRLQQGVQLITHASASAGVKKGEDNPMPDVAARRFRRPVVFANRWYPAKIYRGNSQICDADGNVLAQVGPHPNVIVDAVVELPPVATP
ncbi:MAG TPA: carbon-nitrogen hydrolase family protein [Candidatus Binatia bacterium]|nr:carbon-nitrogen hydrolase family protein [Candidatus Binatia bacterium]